MNQFENQPEFFDRPVLLTEAQIENPLQVLRMFFSNCHLHEAKNSLMKMVEAALIARHTIYDDADQRSHLLWFQRELELLLEAAMVLCEQSNSSLSEIELTGTVKGPQGIWKSKSMLEEEIRDLRIKTAEQERELMELRYFKKHGKPFDPGQ